MVKAEAVAVVAWLMGWRCGEGWRLRSSGRTARSATANGAGMEGRLIGAVPVGPGRACVCTLGTRGVGRMAWWISEKYLGKGRGGSGGVEGEGGIAVDGSRWVTRSLGQCRGREGEEGAGGRCFGYVGERGGGVCACLFSHITYPACL